MSVCLSPSNFAARARRICRALYMNIYVCFIAAGDMGWPYRVEGYKAFTTAEEEQTLRECVSMLRYTYTVCLVSMSYACWWPHVNPSFVWSTNTLLCERELIFVSEYFIKIPVGASRRSFRRHCINFACLPMTKELLSPRLNTRRNGSVGIVTGLGVDDQGIGWVAGGRYHWN